MLLRSAQTDPCFNDYLFLYRIRATNIQQLIFIATLDFTAFQVVENTAGFLYQITLTL